MSSLRRIVWLATLVFFVAGCASSRFIPWDPDTPPESREATASTLGIEPGMVVTVTMTDGQGMTGRILTFDEVNLTIQKTTDPAKGAERILPWDEISSIETGSSGGGSGAGLVVLGVIVIVVAIVIVANEMSELNNMFSSE